MERRHSLRTAAFAIAIGVAGAALPARAAIFTFTIDPTQSYLQVATTQSGVRFTVPGPFASRFVATAAQTGPGIAGGTLPGGVVSDGTRTALSGRIVANVRPSAFSVLAPETLVTLGTFGAFRPGPAANRATPAPANLAAHLEDLVLGISSDVVLRHAAFSMYGDEIALTPTTPGVFTFSPDYSLAPAWMDGAYDSTLNGISSTLAATNIQPFASSGASGNFEQFANGGIRLTLPIVLQVQPFGTTLVGVPLPANLEIRVTGQIVATVPEAAPSLSAIAALLALLSLRRRCRRPGRAALFALAALLLVSSACDEFDFELDTSNEGAESAGVSMNIENGALSAVDENTAAPNAVAEVVLDGTVDGAPVAGGCTGELVSRPFNEDDIFFILLTCNVSSDGGNLSFAFDGHIEGNLDYTTLVPEGEEDPDALPFVWILDGIEDDPSDVLASEATVTCDGLSPTSLTPNDSTFVPANPSPGFGSQRIGNCTFSLTLSGSRTNAATDAFQVIAEIHPPRMGSQVTATRCAEQDPANPYPTTNGSCGNGIGTQCQHSSHCASGYSCAGGICSNGESGAFCAADFQCDPGTICTFGSCAPPAATCDPVEQTGCGAGEKCDGVFGTTPQGAQGRLTRCTANGEAAKGGTCQPIGAGATSCQRGLTCDGFVCRTWCHTADDCDAGEACDVSKTGLPFDPAGDLLEGDGGRCRDAETCLGCR